MTAVICRKYMMKLDKDFYTRDALIVAPELLGKYLVRNIKGHTLVAMITETEAYRSDDKACHAYNYSRTPRTSTMFMEGGAAYVYFTYGMYHCFNVVTDIKDEPSAVLIRGLEPVSDMEYMSELRYKKPLNELTKYQLKTPVANVVMYCDTAMNPALSDEERERCMKILKGQVSQGVLFCP